MRLILASSVAWLCLSAVALSAAGTSEVADAVMRGDQAAVVKLVVTKGEHGYKFADSPWEQIAQVIRWLEAPR